jgi:hypothetical protein
MGKWRDEPMHTGGVMNAGQAPYQKAANDECRICGGTRAILSFFFFSSFTNGSKIHALADFQRSSSYSYYYAHITGIGHW